jgi:hypothetical protein
MRAGEALRAGEAMRAGLKICERCTLAMLSSRAPDPVPARARSVGFQRRKANPISPGNDLFHRCDGERKNLSSSSLHGRDFEHEHEEKPISQRPLAS